MKLTVPIFLFFSFCVYAEPLDTKIESLLSHLSDNDENGQELVLEENLHGGRVLKLSNGTMWEVAPQNLEITEIWIFPFPIKVEKSGNETYPYYLVNKRSKTKVLVRPLSRSYTQDMETQKPS